MKKYYYKAQGKKGGWFYIAQEEPAKNEKFEQITQAEYDEAMERNIKAEKEVVLRRLMLELYPPEEG